MEKQFDLYWTFRSPYCYLAGGWLLDLVETSGLTCKFKPVCLWQSRSGISSKHESPEAALIVGKRRSVVEDNGGRPPLPEQEPCEFKAG